MSSSQILSATEGTHISNATAYRSIVGALQYYTLTRPDINFAINKGCQFTHSPTDVHWKAVKLILRYLKGTIHHGVSLQGSKSLSLSCYTNADWASCPDDRRRTSGFCVFLGQSLISWTSSKQKVISRSSTKSEYRGVANAAAELIWIESLLKELLVPLSSPPVIFCDNLSATYLAVNPILHARTKHVEIDYHY